MEFCRIRSNKKMDWYKEEWSPPILFNIMINDIFTDLPRNVSHSLYADDCLMWVRGRRILPLIETMQMALDCVSEWTDRWGFVFAPHKCNAIIFRRFMKERELQNIPELKLYDQPVAYTDEVKYLGVMLDSRLNLNKHVQYIKGKATKRISILKCLAGRGLWSRSYCTDSYLQINDTTYPWLLLSDLGRPPK